jgi:hypothetical protein
MKKQIFILVLAIFANVAAFGQMTHNSPAVPLVGCTTDALHPLAGVPYNYAVTVNPTGGNFQWWATKDYNFITTTAGVVTNNSASKLTVGTGLLANVNITWSSATLAGTTLASPTFVAVQYDGISPNCANNLKVYQITPVNGFTVDIKSMDQTKLPLAYTATYAFCASNIASAVYNPGTSAIVTNYGTNELYFEVVAANLTGGYTPSFQVSGLGAGQTVTSVNLYTDVAMATTAIPTTLAAGIYSTAAPVTVDGTVTNTTDGVSLYVKLTIDNGTHENLAGDPITLAVNGTNTAGEDDVVNTACTTVTPFEDTVTQTITARPTVTAAAPAVFVTP